MTTPAQCPLCDEAAEYEGHSGFRLHWRCRNCTEFVLRYQDEAWMRSRDKLVRAGLSSEARAVTDSAQVYVITVDRSDPRGKHLSGAARTRSEVLDQ